jgi:hypothetical protein
MSDVNKTTRRTTDFIWFPPSDLQVRSVAKQAPGRTVPNIHFVSEHVALFAELEMSMMMKQIQDSTTLVSEKEISSNEDSLAEMNGDDPFAE